MSEDLYVFYLFILLLLVLWDYFYSMDIFGHVFLGILGGNVYASNTWIGRNVLYISTQNENVLCPLLPSVLCRFEHFYLFHVCHGQPFSCGGWKISHTLVKLSICLGEEMNFNVCAYQFTHGPTFLWLNEAWINEIWQLSTKNVV